MVSRDEIRYAYLLLLGREPEDEQAYDAHSIHPDIQSLRNHILRSEESIIILRQTIKEADSALKIDYYKPVTVFIHIEKTGGTSITQFLSEHFGPDRSSSSHYICLPACSMAELNRYDLIAGHITFQEALAVPRHPKRIITIFREPYSRLISLYRFHRAHPEWSRVNPLVHLSKDLDPVAFFSHRDVRHSPLVDNAYLRAFAEVPADPTWWYPERTQIAQALAMDRLSILDCVGILEKLPETLRQIARILGRDSIESLPRLNVSDELYLSHDEFSAVQKVAHSDELKHVIEPLVQSDTLLYETAKALLAKGSPNLETEPARRGF